MVFFSVIKEGKGFCLSRPDQRRQLASLSVSNVFYGVHPSLDTIQKLSFDRIICDGVSCCFYNVTFLNTPHVFHYITCITMYLCTIDCILDHYYEITYVCMY